MSGDKILLTLRFEVFGLWWVSFSVLRQKLPDYIKHRFTTRAELKAYDIDLVTSVYAPQITPKILYLRGISSDAHYHKSPLIFNHHNPDERPFIYNQLERWKKIITDQLGFAPEVTVNSFPIHKDANYSQIIWNWETEISD